MGRLRDYDEEAVLSGAMQAFRRKGYRGASIRDLEEATGLKAGSIYNSFTDKAGLFDAAFEHYNRIVLAGRIARYAPAAAGLGGLRKLFSSLLHERNGETFGCLITNAATEFGGDLDRHRGVSAGLDVLQRTFAQRLGAARQQGRLRPGIDAKVAATKLLALYQGILVLLRAGHSKTALARLIDDEFDGLESGDGA